MPEALFAAVGALSGVIAAISALSLKFGSSIAAVLGSFFERRQRGRHRRALLNLSARADEETRARILLLLAESDLLRSVGLEEDAEERERESNEVAASSAAKGDEAS
jgi:hypothetical protein